MTTCPMTTHGYQISPGTSAMSRHLLMLAPRQDSQRCGAQIAFATIFGLQYSS